MARHATTWRRASGRPFPAAPTALALALIVSLTGSVAAARPLAQAQDESPARGHAQVVAQGVAPMPQVPVAWRAIAADARPPAEAPVAERSLGFVVADGAPVVVTQEASGDQTRLAPGEALFVPQGARQRRAGLPDTPVGYYGLELVVAPDVAAAYSLGNAALLFAGDPFLAPPGRRDLDLVRDTLAPGETARLPGSAAPALLLVTDGAVRVQPVGGQTQTLRTYDAASLNGALNITATGGAGATFLAAVIGPAVDVAAPPAALPAPPDVPLQRPTGTVAVAPHACPDGMRPERFDPLACAPAPDVIALQTFVLGSGDNLRTLADATYQDGTYLWSDLPFAEYLVQATDLAPGYDRYLIPGLDGINAPPERGYTTGPNEGYLVPLAAATPNYELAVYAFRDALPATGAPATLGIFVWQCAPGVVARPDMTGADCVRVDPLASGFDVAIAGGGLAAPLTLAGTAPADAAGRLWQNVPLGDYTITATLPPGADGYALRSARADFPIRLLPDGTGYTFALTDALFDPASDLRRVNIEAYLLVE